MPLELIRNDITLMNVDAIVNASNTMLSGGGGLDEAIHRAAGPKLLEECKTLGGCKTGEAKLTNGYHLPCKYVIHTAGPIWQGGTRGERELLTACYQNALELAKQHNCETIAFPLISSGLYGYPKAQALQVAIDAITGFLLQNDMTVYIVVFTKEMLEISKKLFSSITAYIDDVYANEHIQPIEETSRDALANAYLRIAYEQEPADTADATPEHNLDAMLQQTDEGFVATLLRLIDDKQMTDVQCYRKANIDRRLFHKIRSNADYKPSKQTVIAFAIALELTLAQTNELLMKAGYALSHSNKADIIIEYYIRKRNYNIMEINQVLFEFDLQPLGY